MNAAAEQRTVMIVDDEPDNLNVLGDMLCREGFGVRAFPNGGTAFESAREDPPALVLLDIRMPGMDGYQVCQLFKADDDLSSVPIIFLSAFSEADDKVRAFDAGGADYVTKPFSEFEVVARVHTQLRLREQQRRLEELVFQRVRDLAEAHRRLRILDGAKSRWLHMISHELRTPLTALFGIPDILLKQLPLDSEMSQLTTGFDEACSHITKLVDDATMIAQVDVAAVRLGEDAACLRPLLESAFAAASGCIDEDEARAALAAAESVRVSGEEVLLKRALDELVQAVVGCSGENEPISLGAASSLGLFRMTLETSGRRLAPEAVASFFEVGGQRALDKAGGDIGLGSALANRILRLFGGGASLRNGSERGFVLEIELPVRP